MYAGRDGYSTSPDINGPALLFYTVQDGPRATSDLNWLDRPFYAVGVGLIVSLYLNCPV